MLATVDYEVILKNKENYIFVDVRTPREFSEFTIPNSINIPIFENEHYEKIGTLYKKLGKEEAIKLGISFISIRLSKIYSQFLDLSKKGKKIAVFCARGGMRSTSIASLIQSLGLNLIKVNYGYKGYRNYISNTLPKLIENFQFVSLYGKTGTGKTFILYELEKLNIPVLDLEGCANHRGSILGSIGLSHCNSQKMFESLVFDKLWDTKEGIIFCEGESKRIGRIIMPNFLYDAIINSKKLLIDAEMPKRVENIHKEYLKDNFDSKEIIEAILNMKKYIGIQKAEEYCNLIKQEKYDIVIEALMSKYYDNAYSIKNKFYEKTFINNDEKNTAQKIIEYIRNESKLQVNE